MLWLRDAGPTVVSSLTTLVAIFGMTRAWPFVVVTYLFLFAIFLLLASIAARAITRACQRISRRWIEAIQ
jgi:multisubunit Na+/H+ antiporter MnhG subunit